MAKFELKNVKIKATNGGNVQGYDDVKVEDSKMEFKEKGIDFSTNNNKKVKKKESSLLLKLWKLISENPLISAFIVALISYLFFS